MSDSLLWCGIENGQCMVFDTVTCEYVDHMQMQAFNCALTQIERIQETMSMPGMASSQRLNVLGGNAKCIEFATSNSVEENANAKKLAKYDALKIDHGHKINCLKVFNKQMFVADTTNGMSIYDLSDF